MVFPYINSRQGWFFEYACLSLPKAKCIVSEFLTIELAISAQDY